MAESSSHRPRSSSGLGNLLYCSTLLAACLGSLGFWGLLLAPAILFFRRVGGFKVIDLLASFTALTLFAGLLTPVHYSHSIERSQEQAKQRFAALQDLAYAAKHYCRREGAYPKDFKTSSGQSISWRVKLLTCLEDHDEINEYGLDVDPEEQGDDYIDEVAEFMPESMSYYYRSANRGIGSYYAVTGENTAWSEARAIPEYTNWNYESEKLLLVEVGLTSGKPDWFSGLDLTPEAAIKLLTKRPRDGPEGPTIDYGMLWRTVTIRHIAFADGTVRRLHCPLSEQLAETLVNTKRELDRWQRWELEIATWRPLDYRVCIGWPLLAIVATWPLARRLIRRPE